MNVNQKTDLIIGKELDLKCKLIEIFVNKRVEIDVNFQTILVQLEKEIKDPQTHRSKIPYGFQRNDPTLYRDKMMELYLKQYIPCLKNVEDLSMKRLNEYFETSCWIQNFERDQDWIFSRAGCESITYILDDSPNFNEHYDSGIFVHSKFWMTRNLESYILAKHLVNYHPLVKELRVELNKVNENFCWPVLFMFFFI